MGLIFTESFDSSLYQVKWDVFATATGSGRHGNGGQQTTPSSTPSAIRKTFAGDETGDQHATFIVGFAARIGGGTAESAWIQMLGDANATTHLTVSLTYDGSNIATFKLYRGTTGGTLLATATYAWGTSGSSGVWHYVEIKALLGSSGIAELRVDGVAVISFTGNTKNGGTASVFDTVSLYLNDAIATASTLYIDDIYVCNGAGSANNDFLGDVTVLSATPNANGDLSQQVNNAGNSTNNYSHVDDNNTATYCDGVNTNDEDLYNLGDISGYAAPFIMAGVVAYAYVKKSDTGARSYSIQGKLAGTEVGTSSLTLTTSYVTKKRSFDVEPAGGAWSFTDFNSFQVGSIAL